MRNCVNERRINSPVSLKQTLSCAVNLREIELKLSSFDDHDKLHFLTEFPFCLEGAKDLSKVTVNLSKHIWELCYIKYKQYDKIVDGMMTHLSQQLGVRSQKTYTIPRDWDYDPARMYSADEIDKWIWEAYPGQLMNWSKKLGRVWKFPQERPQGWTPVEDTDMAVGQCHVLEITGRLRTWNWETDYEVPVEVAQSRGIRMGYGELTLKDTERYIRD